MRNRRDRDHFWCHRVNNLKGLARHYQRNANKTGHVITVLTEHKAVLDLACWNVMAGTLLIWKSIAMVSSARQFELRSVKTRCGQRDMATTKLGHSAHR